MKIPRIAILGVTTTAACADPIIGDWNLNEVCMNGNGEEYCQSFPQTYENGDAVSILMTVEDDWSGEMKQIVTGEDAATYSFPLTTEKEADKQYNITIDTPDTPLLFNCSMASESMDCEMSSSGITANYKFLKQ